MLALCHRQPWAHNTDVWRPFRRNLGWTAPHDNTMQLDHARFFPCMNCLHSLPGDFFGMPHCAVCIYCFEDKLRCLSQLLVCKDTILRCAVTSTAG